MPQLRARNKNAPRHRLAGRTAVITGASRGIGLALARALAAEGCDLVLTARKLKPLEKAARDITEVGVRVFFQACDVRDPQAVRHLAAEVRKHFPRVDILINNAGVAHPNLPVDQLPAEQWKEVVDTNLTGTFLVCQAMLPFMHRGATVVNNLSIAAIHVFPGSSAYNASKHGALGLTRTLREELRPRGIRVMALLPGATDTEIWNTLWREAPRAKMLPPTTVAEALLNALLLPANSTVEELTILPTAGKL